MCIFCFPVAVWQSKGVYDFTIRSDTSGTCLGPCIRGGGACLFTEQCKIGLVAIMLEQILECSTNSAFIFFTESGVFLQCSVVSFDRFMRRFVRSDIYFPRVLLASERYPIIHGVGRNCGENLGVNILAAFRQRCLRHSTLLGCCVLGVLISTLTARQYHASGLKKFLVLKTPLCSSGAICL